MSDDAELPEGWTRVRLGDAITLQRGFDLPVQSRRPGSVPIYASNGLIASHDVPRVNGPGVVTGRSGTIGKVYVIRGDFWPLNTALFVKDFHGNNPDFVAWVLRSVDLKQFSSSTAVPTLNRNNVHECEIQLPPLAEQLRIAATLDNLAQKVSSSQQRLLRVPALLKRFRQSVLAAACSGKLTADWRDDDSWEDDLPIGWQRIVLNELLPRGGIFDGPFGSNLKTSDYTASGIRVVRLENIGHLEFNLEKETFISKAKYETLAKHTIREGDILFASFISDEVRACVLPNLVTTAIAKADCFCLRPFSDRINRSYLTYQLVSQESYDTLVADVHGATRPRINTTQLRNLSIRVAPLAEQLEIVRRVESLFAFADQIEARLKQAQAHVDRLTQSILAKAFRGELVPTEVELARREGRDYEPASALLAKIQANQNEAKQPRSKKQKSPR